MNSKAWNTFKTFGCEIPVTQSATGNYFMTAIVKISKVILLDKSVIGHLLLVVNSFADIKKENKFKQFL